LGDDERSSTVGAVTRWVMTSASQFHPAPPPPLDSATWTHDLNEIREVGAHDSSKRTAEQTTIARFWFLTGARARHQRFAHSCLGQQ